MKLLTLRKDGGPLSKVWGFFLVEIKCAFTIVLLVFKDGSREAYHTHAFNAVSWVLWGRLLESNYDGGMASYGPSLRPVWTPRERFHKVTSEGTSWVLSFRGPWVNTWREFIPTSRRFLTLTHGRKVTANVPAVPTT